MIVILPQHYFAEFYNNKIRLLMALINVAE